MSDIRHPFNDVLISSNGRTQTTEILDVLKTASALQEPSVDVRQFLAFPPTSVAESEDGKVPALMIYLLNIFAKAIISQLIGEAGISPKYAEPVGIIAAKIFSNDVFIYRGCSMIDILLAKYHVVCPVLWGFYGDEKTNDGKIALGWWRQEPNGPFVTAQVHEERMTGLAAGYAALSLRNFGKTPRKNPLPNYHFWKTLSCIVNVPPGEVQNTHLVALNALLRNSAVRVVKFWGDLGLAMLRHCIVTFPAALPHKSTASNTLGVLRDIYAREQHILI
jgi:nucleoporin GLE1